MRVLARITTLGSLGLFLSTAPAAFAQDPNAYPPPQYPQQAPQQQYPQQQYPQQQYPQQQYPQQQYPQQQTYPPAGYAAPAPAAPPSYGPAYMPPPAPADLRRGGLAILTLGLNVPVGSGSEGYSAGASLGGIFGGHLSRDLSLNGEFSMHVLNADAASSSETEAIVDLAFSPFYHFGQGNLEIAIGPKLGWFGYTLSYDGTDDKISAYGYSYGFNAAAFFQISPTLAVGGLLNYTGRHATKLCATVNGYEDCANADSDNDMDVVTLNGAVRW